MKAKPSDFNKFLSGIFLIVIFLGNCVFTVKAQQQIAESKELPFPGQLMKREPEGNYLAPLAALKKREPEYLASEQWRSFFLDMMSYASSYVGNYAEAIAYQDAQKQGPDKPKFQASSVSSLGGYKPKNALTVIAKVAERERVIMINELHHAPMHRAFTAELLPILYKKGFRYLAVEAVNEKDTQLNERRYPVYKTGGYTSEPVFGDVLRTAHKLGFKIVPYEHQVAGCQPKPNNKYYCQNERERGQAQSIYDRILEDDPEAKILVHAGMGHIQEDVYNENLSIMAAHFKAISRIDPFTIDQTEMIEHSQPEYEEADYRYATGKNLIKEPTIFESSDGKFWKKQPGQYSSVDAQIFPPRVGYRKNRPRWLEMNGARKPKRLNSKTLFKKPAKLEKQSLALLGAGVCERRIFGQRFSRKLPTACRNLAQTVADRRIFTNQQF